MIKKILTFAIVCALSLSFTSCTNRDKNLGTAKNPVIIGFMPSAATDVMAKNSAVVTDELAKASGYAMKPYLSNNFIALIEGLASKKIDFAFMNSLGFLLSHDWSGSGADVQLKGVDGRKMYNSAIIINTGSGIKDLKDLNGKKLAYTEPYSMAGYLQVMAYLAQNGIKPASTTFAGSYDQVVELVYNGTVDAGAIFYHETDPYGRIRDARLKQIDAHQDLLRKVHLLVITGMIPNTPVVYRKEIPEEMRTKLDTAFLGLNENPLALTAIGAMYDSTGFAKINSEDFDDIRKTLKSLGKDLVETVPGAVSFWRKNIWEAIPGN